MRIARLWIVLAFTLSASPRATAQSSKSYTQIVPATKEMYSLLRRYPEIDGTIVDVARGQLTLRVIHTHQVLANGQSSLNEINRSVMQLQHARMRGTAAASALQQVIARNIKTIKESIDFVLPLPKEATIRKLSKDVEFDDKGFPKPRNSPNTRGEIGYPATVAELVYCAQVKVKFQNRYGPVPLPPLPKFIGAEASPPPPPNEAPRIGRIVITTDQFGSPLLGATK